MSAYAQAILPEFDHEMASTRKVIERLPDDKLGWRHHPKSNTLGWIANHVVNMVAWTNAVLEQPALDLAPPGGPAWSMPSLGSRQELLDAFDKHVAAARLAISEVKDAEMGHVWSLSRAGQVFFSMPRAAVMRSFVLNHIIHHRAQLCVDLRLLDIPVPGLYGPSGDE